MDALPCLSFPAPARLPLPDLGIQKRGERGVRSEEGPPADPPARPSLSLGNFSPPVPQFPVSRLPLRPFADSRWGPPLRTPVSGGSGGETEARGDAAAAGALSGSGGAKRGSAPPGGPDLPPCGAEPLIPDLLLPLFPPD